MCFTTERLHLHSDIPRVTSTYAIEGGTLCISGLTARSVSYVPKTLWKLSLKNSSAAGKFRHAGSLFSGRLTSVRREKKNTEKKWIMNERICRWWEKEADGFLWVNQGRGRAHSHFLSCRTCLFCCVLADRESVNNPELCWEWGFSCKPSCAAFTEAYHPSISV